MCSQAYWVPFLLLNWFTIYLQCSLWAFRIVKPSSQWSSLSLYNVHPRRYQPNVTMLESRCHKALEKRSILQCELPQYAVCCLLSRLLDCFFIWNIQYQMRFTGWAAFLAFSLLVRERIGLTMLSFRGNGLSDFSHRLKNHVTKFLAWASYYQQVCF